MMKFKTFRFEGFEVELSEFFVCMRIVEFNYLNVSVEDLFVGVVFPIET